MVNNFEDEEILLLFANFQLYEKGCYFFVAAFWRVTVYLA